MRLEVGDPGAARARVFLDGIEQKSCVLADSTLNYVRRYKRVGGTLVTDGNDEFVLETVFGSVVIEIPEESS